MGISKKWYVKACLVAMTTKLATICVACVTGAHQYCGCLFG
jgi:hypothetical protein